MLNFGAVGLGTVARTVLEVGPLLSVNALMASLRMLRRKPRKLLPPR